MPIADARDAVLFLPVMRGGYYHDRSMPAKHAMREAAQALGIDAIFPADDACSDGLVCGPADVREYWQTWRARISEIKAVVVTSSDFMDERTVQDTVRLLPEDVPVFLIVNNDDPQKMGEDVGDSLCGSLSVHHNMRMLGRRILRGCRINMYEEDVLQRFLGEYVQLADGIESLRNLRIGMLGVNPNPFATTFTNQMKLFELGFSLNTYELLQMWGDVVLGAQPETAEKTYQGDFGQVRLRNPVPADDPDVAPTMEELAEVMPDITEHEHHERIARALVWVRRVFEQDCIDVGAIHCWGEFSSFFGFAPCNFAMASNMAGRPIVCEVDVCHAIMAKLGWTLTGEPPVILDINNNGWDPRVFNVFHCSQTPNNWMCEKACITGYGSLEGMMAPGRFTGISASTTSSEMKTTVFQGAFLQRRPGQRGCSGWAFVPNNQEVLKAIEDGGIHHFVALKGQLGGLVADALRFRGIQVNNLSCEVPDVGTIEDDLPDPGSAGATGYRVYSE